MDERMRRLWVGVEAEALGHGGIATVARATGMAISTVTRGRNEARAAAAPANMGRVRRAVKDTQQGIMDALESLVDPATRGDPESPLRWTCKSTQKLATELCAGLHDWQTHGAKLLRERGYSLQGTHKTVEGSLHPDRNAQFEFLRAREWTSWSITACSSAGG